MCAWRRDALFTAICCNALIASHCNTWPTDMYGGVNNADMCDCNTRATHGLRYTAIYTPRTTYDGASHTDMHLWLQHTATQWLQHNATHELWMYEVVWRTNTHGLNRHMLQNLDCNTLQHTATQEPQICKAAWGTPTLWNSRRVATHCNALQQLVRKSWGMIPRVHINPVMFWPFN